MTTLSSKIINVHKKKMAKIAVDAVMAVANLERNDVNFDMIKVGKAAGQIRGGGGGLVGRCFVIFCERHFEGSGIAEERATADPSR